MDQLGRKLTLTAVALTGQALYTAAQALSNDNSTDEVTITPEGVRLPVCKKGLLLPLWTPVDNLSAGDKAARAIVYFLSLIFLFLGVSIIADRFMGAIEVITSQEREIIVKRPNGEIIKVSVKVWNETVSNLTLMALGSSAPEILLAIIEVAGKPMNYFSYLVHVALWQKMLIYGEYAIAYNLCTHSTKKK